MQSHLRRPQVERENCSNYAKGLERRRRKLSKKRSRINKNPTIKSNQASAERFNADHKGFACMVTALDIRDMDINKDGTNADGHTTTDDLDAAACLPPGHE